MTETIDTKYGTFNKLSAEEKDSCKLCDFHDEKTSACLRPLDFNVSCTNPDDLIFQAVKVAKDPDQPSKIYTEDKKYYLIPQAGCFGCCFTSGPDCKKPGGYPQCTPADNHGSCIYQVASAIDRLLSTKPVKSFVKPKRNQDIIGDLMTIKHDDLVIVSAEISGCRDCWFMQRGSCCKLDWSEDEDMPASCDDIIFTMYTKPQHDTPKWDRDEVEVKMEEEKDDAVCAAEEVEKAKEDRPYEGLTIKSKAGGILTYVKELVKDKCTGCYFESSKYCIGQDLISHSGWILVENPSLNKKYPMTPDECFPKKELDLTIKKQKKFSI